MENVKARVLISGKVQGVFFRAWTQRKAQTLGLKGWVRNTPNGRVEAVFEGEKAGVTEMIKNCRQGPRLAKVGKVEIKWSQSTREFSSFKARS